MSFLALRYLLCRKRQTLLIVLGAILGTVAYIAVSGIMGGFNAYIVDRLIASDAHVRIQAGDYSVSAAQFKERFYPHARHVFWITPPSGRFIRPYITFPDRWFHRLRQDSGVEAFTPQLILRVNVKRLNALKPVRLIGTDPAQQARVTNIGTYMTRGKFEDLELGGNRLVVGQELLDKMGSHVGDTLLVITEEGQSFPFVVAGVYQTGVKNIDEFTMYASLKEAQAVAGRAGYLTDIAVRLKDFQRAQEFDEKWTRLYPESIQTWQELNANSLSIFKIQSIVGIFMIGTILVVMAFGIYNMLQMLVNQKQHEIGILRAMGYEPKDVAKLFLLQGAYLGLGGGVMGLALGFFFSHFIHRIKVGSLNIAVAGRLAVSFDPVIYLTAFAVTFLACVLSSYLPSRAARRLSPIEILRGQ